MKKWKIQITSGEIFWHTLYRSMAPHDLPSPIYPSLERERQLTLRPVPFYGQHWILVENLSSCGGNIFGAPCIHRSVVCWLVEGRSDQHCEWSSVTSCSACWVRNNACWPSRPPGPYRCLERTELESCSTGRRGRALRDETSYWVMPTFGGRLVMNKEIVVYNVSSLENRQTKRHDRTLLILVIMCWMHTTKRKQPLGATIWDGGDKISYGNGRTALCDEYVRILLQFLSQILVMLLYEAGNWH